VRNRRAQPFVEPSPPRNHARLTIRNPQAITDLFTWQVQSVEGIDYLKLRPWRSFGISVSDEEMNDATAHLEIRDSDL